MDTDTDMPDAQGVHHLSEHMLKDAHTTRLLQYQ